VGVGVEALCPERGVHGVAQQPHRLRVLAGRGREDQHRGGELSGERVGHLGWVGGVEDDQAWVGPREGLRRDPGAARAGEHDPDLPGHSPLLGQRRDLADERPRRPHRAGPAWPGHPRPQRRIAVGDASGDAVLDEAREHLAFGRRRSGCHRVRSPCP
jgi:hypothetical protein